MKKRRSFAYFDHPYRPLTNTSSFTAYTAGTFDDAQQLMLASFAAALDKKGAKVIISNSDHKNINVNDDFFDNAYSSFNVKRVSAARMINSNSASRGKINELLISNF